MPERTRHDGDWDWTGNHRFFGEFSVPNGSITNAAIKENAAFAADKLDHRYNPTESQPNTAATAETRVLYRARAAGKVLAFDAGALVAATGNSTVTVDLQKSTGGAAFATVLTGTVQLTSASAAIVPVVGSLVVTPTYVAGDVFRIVQTISAGTGTLPTGVFWSGEFEEGA